MNILSVSQRVWQAIVHSCRSVRGRVARLLSQFNVCSVLKEIWQVNVPGSALSLVPLQRVQI